MPWTVRDSALNPLLSAPTDPPTAPPPPLWLIPGRGFGLEGAVESESDSGPECEGRGRVMEVNSPSLFTGCKGSRQSVSALVPGQSYMSLYINAQTWQTAV